MQNYLAPHPAALQSQAFETVETQIGSMPIPEPFPKPKVDSWGLITLACDGFIPKSARSSPPSLTDGMSREISQMLMAVYNASDHARDARRWMVLTCNGTVLILTGIAAEERPSDPTAFVPSILAGYPQKQAESVMRVQNEERFRIAKSPRTWVVAVQPNNLEWKVTQ